MAEYTISVFITQLILVYGLFLKALEKTVVSALKLFFTVGIFVSFFHFEAFKEWINAPMIKILARLTLVLIL